jgi:O-antigen/teichoic acid export membrane protein
VSHGTRLGGLLMLYGSRLAGIAVSLFFLPLYARLLGTGDFGWAALILSGQMLMTMLDLGMAALTTRDLAATPDAAAAVRGWRRAEHLLGLYFAALGLLAMAAAAALGQPVGLAAGALALFWALTAQNLSQAAMLARGQVQQAALLQGAGVMARALLSAAVLLYVEASLRAFVASQLAGALLHLLASRCQRSLAEGCRCSSSVPPGRPCCRPTNSSSAPS